jgi:hypothetical protein
LEAELEDTPVNTTVDLYWLRTDLNSDDVEILRMEYGYAGKEDDIIRI